MLDELELPLIPVLADMEAAGVAIDREALAGLSRAFADEIARLEEEIYDDVGHQFTLGSPKQLEQVLFYELNLPRGRRTKTGFSTDAGVLEDLRAGAPDGRQAARVAASTPSCARPTSTRCRCCSTPLDRPAAHDLPPGRGVDRAALARPTRTSRTSPSAPSSGGKIRHAFVAGDRRTRCCWPPTTARSSCASWPTCRATCTSSEAFERRADIHRETAARVLHKDPADVTADERSMAKMVNFGLAYGMSDFGLSSRANIPRAGGAGVHQLATSRPTRGISYYMMHIKEIAREQGYVETLFGRRRWIPELRHATRRCAAPASGWPSTCPSRARPRTS